MSRTANTVNWKSIEGLPAPLLTKYFAKKGMGWQVQEDIRRRIDFKPMNLAGPWLTFPPMDLVFVRNVMIYFDMDTKKKILGNIRKILRSEWIFVFRGIRNDLES